MSFEPQILTSKEFVQRTISFIFWRDLHRLRHSNRRQQCMYL
jgi:hypothetical protein